MGLNPCDLLLKVNVDVNARSLWVARQIYAGPTSARGEDLNPDEEPVP